MLSLVTQHCNGTARFISYNSEHKRTNVNVYKTWKKYRENNLAPADLIQDLQPACYQFITTPVHSAAFKYVSDDDIFFDIIYPLIIYLQCFLLRSTPTRSVKVLSHSDISWPTSWATYAWTCCQHVERHMFENVPVLLTLIRSVDGHVAAHWGSTSRCCSSLGIPQHREGTLIVRHSGHYYVQLTSAVTGQQLQLLPRSVSADHRHHQWHRRPWLGSHASLWCKEH